MPRRVYPNLLAYFRQNPDETLTKVADELGVSLSYLSMIKNGERQPTLQLGLDIAERCGVPLESLVRKAS